MLNPDTIDRDRQREQALVEANARRSAAARIKARLRQRTLTLQELLADPPEALESLMTWEVLRWAPGMGPGHLQQLNVRAARQRQANLAMPLGRLTDRQRQWLADQLPTRR